MANACFGIILQMLHIAYERDDVAGKPRDAMLIDSDK